MKKKDQIISLFWDKMNVFKNNFPLQFSTVETHSDFSEPGGKQMWKKILKFFRDRSHSTKCPSEGWLRRNVRNNIFTFLCPTTQTLIYTGQSAHGMCRSRQPLAGWRKSSDFWFLCWWFPVMLLCTQRASTGAGRTLSRSFGFPSCDGPSEEKRGCHSKQ